jgi:hypothetical protein
MKFLVQGHPSIAIPLFTKLITGHNEAMLKYKLDFQCFIKIGRRRMAFWEEDSLSTSSVNLQAGVPHANANAHSHNLQQQHSAADFSGWTMPKEDVISALSRYCISRQNSNVAQASLKSQGPVGQSPNQSSEQQHQKVAIMRMAILCECYAEMQRYGAMEERAERKVAGRQIFEKYLSRESHFKVCSLNSFIRFP